GYAKFNKILSPDLAILEGGYSVETALPYINLGIVLAMANEDISGVVEPDFESYKTAQTQEITDYIEEISQIILTNWKHREKIAKDKFKDQKKISKHQNIYYD